MWNSPCVRMGIAVCLVFAMARGVAAQRMFVVTTSLSAARESARMYAQSVDLASGTVLPMPQGQLGSLSPSPLCVTRDGVFALVSSVESVSSPTPEQRAVQSCLRVYAAATMRPFGTALAPPGWREGVGCEVSPEVFAAAGVRRVATRGEPRMEGRLAIWNLFPGQPDTLLRNEGASIGLSGLPVSVCGLRDGRRVAVLCRGVNGAPDSLYEVTVAGTSLSTVHALAAVEGAVGCEARACARSSNGRWLFVLRTGHAADRPAGDPVSWVDVFDATTFSPIKGPVAVPGAAGDQALCPAGDDACWVSSYSSGGRFAYVTRLRAKESELVKEAQVSFDGGAEAPRLAAEPSGPRVAAGLGHALEVWTGLERGQIRHDYKGMIACLVWTDEGLVVGEGGRVHLVDPATAGPLRSVQLQSGHVSALALTPKGILPTPDSDSDGMADNTEIGMGLSPVDPDTDGDGIPDGADPEPLVASPVLRTPASVTFRGETAGQEVKGFTIGDSSKPGYAWEVTVDRAMMPWLVLYPLSGVTPGVLYMGVDPQRYPPGAAVQGTITVSMAGTRPGMSAFLSPSATVVRVLPEGRTEVRRILWLVDDARAEGFAELAAALARPPLLFAHVHRGGSVSEPLGRYSIVVVDAEAVLRGAVTRQQVLEYVAEGGALLLIGHPVAENRGEPLRQWLEPVGIALDPAVAASGPCKVVNAKAPCARWTLERFNNGCEVRAANPSDVLVGTEDGTRAVLVAHAHGLGRIAVLAADGVLRQGTPTQASPYAFAVDLFSWLADPMAEGARQDLDSDRLTDDLEDRNGNNTVDPGETDFLNPDTDGDGLPDGMEDANLNGRVDPGETDPLSRDTDGDGVFDGADEDPLKP